MSDIEQAATVQAINEAWLMIAAALCLGPLALFISDSMKNAKRRSI
jgi:hypothetical protein